MSWTPPERETVINLDDEDPLVRIWTAQLPVITRLTKDPRFTLVRSGEHSAEFTIPADQWNPATGAKRKSAPMTPERRAEAAARFAQARQAPRAVAQHVHNAVTCEPPCPMHAPSAHRLAQARLHWRSDRGLWERICVHGTGHPDPDDLAYKQRHMDPDEYASHAYETHGCCAAGCCGGAA